MISCGTRESVIPTLERDRACTVDSVPTDFARAATQKEKAADVEEAMEKPHQTVAAPEADVAWLDEEHVTLIDDGAGSERDDEQPKRYEHTQRIWCPPR